MASEALKRALKRRKERGKKRGIALIMVLGAITILTVFLTELQTDTSAALAGALAERDRLKAEYYARSAVNLSRMVLSSEPRIRNDPTIALGLQLIGGLMGGGGIKVKQIPVWEFSDMLLGAFNGGDRATVFGSNVQADPTTGKNLGIPGNGYFNVTIIDEDSKFNLNAAAGAAVPQQLILQLATMFSQPQYAEMFQGRDGDNQFTDAATLCSSIIDWADGDENLTNCADTTKPAAGAEDNFYQMVGLDYKRRNEPFDSLEELRLVRGMDDDRWRTFIDPDPNNPRKRNFTVWGQTSVNINTANAQTLWTIICSVAAPQTPVCSDPLQAANFIMVFNLARNFLRGIPLFSSWNDLKTAVEGKGLIGPFLTSLGVPPVQFDPKFSAKDLRKLVNTSSQVFSIYAEGILPGKQREARVRIHAVVDRREATDFATFIKNQQDLAAQNGGVPGQQPAGAGSAGATGPNGQPTDDETKNPYGIIVYYRVD
jgi:general secretion pathway protein K